MSAILTTFGIDWRLLLINGINFVVLLVALWYFLYAPISKMLEERRTKVAAGVAAAQAAEQELKETLQQRSKVLTAATKEADELVEAARASAAKLGSELVQKSEVVAEGIVRDAEAQAKEAKAKAVEESKREVAKLVVLGIEKTLQSK